MKAIIWSREHCTFCEQAKVLLIQKGYIIEERKIGDGYSREELLAVAPSARTVPQIFIDNELVGGFTDLQKYIKEQVDA